MKPPQIHKRLFIFNTNSRMGKMKMEFSEETLPLPPLLLRKVISTIINNADTSSLISYARKYKLLETLRFIFISCYFFFIRFVPSFFLSTFFPPSKYDIVSLTGPNSCYDDNNNKQLVYDLSHARKQLAYDSRAPGNDTAIGRALAQLLLALNDIPVSSRKYEVVRSLAERIIDENHEEGVHALREVNRTVLSAAFERTLAQLEAAVGEQGEGDDYGEYHRVRKVLRAVRTVGLKVAGGGGGGRSSAEGNLAGVTAEKLAAEVLWLGQKLAACGCADEAVWRWAAARNLGWLSLTAEPRLQSSLVKLTAFLFKEAKDMGLDEIDGSKAKGFMQVKFRMLLSWVPLLCRASNGTDAPVLTVRERTELENVLEYIIERLESEEQEQVLSLWLHHFTHAASSDWPNLHNCFSRWCTSSRKKLLLGD